LLPKFDKKTTEAVVDALMTGDDTLPVTGRVLINPVEMKPIQRPHKRFGLSSRRCLPRLAHIAAQSQLND